MNDVLQIKKELTELKQSLEQTLSNQAQIRDEIRMIFADISHFENLVLKILDQLSEKSNVDRSIKEKFHH